MSTQKLLISTSKMRSLNFAYLRGHDLIFLGLRLRVGQVLSRYLKNHTFYEETDGKNRTRLKLNPKSDPQ